MTQRDSILEGQRTLPAQLRNGAARSIAVNRAFILIAVSYIVVAEAASQYYGFPHHLDLYHKPLMPAALYVALAAIVIRLAIERPTRPIAFVADLLMNRWNIVERSLVVVPPVLVLALMMSSFSSIKSSLALLNPYLLDHVFIAWDSALHGGHDPWQLLHPLLAHPIVTAALEQFYGYWLGIMIAVLAYAIFMTRRIELRNQYLVAFVLTWAIPGTLGAIALNSVGPCFHALFFPAGPHPFAPLMAYLDEAAPMTRLGQHYLWRYHQELGPGFGTGISAMPSMHVAVAAVQCVFLWKLSRIAGLLGLAFLIVIQLGSVHLGWHYAIDGYVSMALVPLIWYAAGRIVAFDLGRRRLREAGQPA